MQGHNAAHGSLWCFFPEHNVTAALAYLHKAQLFQHTSRTGIALEVTSDKVCAVVGEMGDQSAPGCFCGISSALSARHQPIPKFAPFKPEDPGKAFLVFQNRSLCRLCGVPWEA